ncbi:MAG: hypothetical protein EB023_06225 [Flavobacteriia bacterium]|nr:hypothetical protein [Flavobacteriia bacterium]
MSLEDYKRNVFSLIGFGIEDPDDLDAVLFTLETLRKDGFSVREAAEYLGSTVEFGCELPEEEALNHMLQIRNRVLRRMNEI